jgi:hypothetical protein
LHHIHKEFVNFQLLCHHNLLAKNQIVGDLLVDVGLELDQLLI